MTSLVDTGQVGRQQRQHERQQRHAQRQREMASVVLARAAPISFGAVGVGAGAGAGGSNPDGNHGIPAAWEPYTLPPLPPSPSNHSESE